MRNINVLVDKTGVLEAMKEELTEYPERLRKAVLDASYPYIWDEENVGALSFVRILCLTIMCSNTHWTYSYRLCMH